MRLSAAQTLVAIASTSGRPSGGPCSAARPHAVTTSSCGGRRRGPGAEQPPPPPGRRLPPCRVTNERRELRDPAAAPDEDDYITVDPDNPVPNPQLGPLERRIGLPYEEALFEDDVDAEAEEYWFTEPADGWNTEKRRLRKLPQEELVDLDVFAHSGEDAAGRVPLGGVREGATLRGTVVAQIWHHGAQVDIGAEYDGLLPCCEEEWEELGGALDVGAEVQVRVHRVRDPTLFRFPVQLAATSGSLAAKLAPPEEHQAPMDLRALTITPEEVCARSEGQRVWEPQDVMVQLQDEYDYEQIGRAHV